jgi:hypothetical protein
MSDSITTAPAPRDTIALDIAIADTRRMIDAVIAYPSSWPNPEGELIALFRQYQGYVTARATA